MFENEGTGLVRAGKCVYISNNQALISFTKNIPAHIVIDKRFTFKYYICKQMYYFSHLSVRGFKPSHKSVTLLYPQLMMQLLTKLKEIQSWDSDSLKFSDCEKEDPLQKDSQGLSHRIDLIIHSLGIYIEVKMIKYKDKKNIKSFKKQIDEDIVLFK